MKAPKHTKACPRCNGKGSIAAFSHHDEGVCYSCGGKGVVKVTEEEYQQMVRTAEILAHPVIEWSEQFGRYTGKHGTETYFVRAGRTSLGYGKTRKCFSVTVVGQKYGYSGIISGACSSIEEAKGLCERYAQGELIPNLVRHQMEVAKATTRGQ